MVAVRHLDIIDEHEDNLILFRRAQHGDRRALDQIIRRELPKVRKMLRRRLGARPDLDDLVQTVFVEFCTAFGKYRGGTTTVSSFIRGYARMVALRAMCPAAWDRRRCALEFEPACGKADLQDTAIAREQVRRVRIALDRVAPRKRAAFMWWALEGKTPEEIATLSNASVTAVRSRIFHAQKELRRMAGRDPYLRELIA